MKVFILSAVLGFVLAIGYALPSFGNDEVQTLNNKLEKTESEFVPKVG